MTGEWFEPMPSPINNPGRQLAWEVRDDYPECTEHYVERGTKAEGNWERAVTIHGNDYGLACFIEAALNLRDGIVE